MRDIKQQIANANEIVSANAKAKEIVNANEKENANLPLGLWKMFEFVEIRFLVLRRKKSSQLQYIGDRNDMRYLYGLLLFLGLESNISSFSCYKADGQARV